MRDGIDGLQFSARNPIALASKMKLAASSEILWEQCVENINKPITFKKCFSWKPNFPDNLFTDPLMSSLKKYQLTEY